MRRVLRGVGGLNARVRERETGGECELWSWEEVAVQGAQNQTARTPMYDPMLKSRRENNMLPISLQRSQAQQH